MVLEKEKRNNMILMIAGAVIALSGLILYTVDLKIAGVLILILGVAMLIISWKISDLMFKLKMIEHQNAKRSKRK